MERDGLDVFPLHPLCASACTPVGLRYRQNAEFVVPKMPLWRRESSTQPGAPFLTPHLLPERKTQGGRLKT